jgi:hypothetical protein
VSLCICNGSAGDPSDTILTIKQKIQAINKVEVLPDLSKRILSNSDRLMVQTADQRLLITEEKIVCDENKVRPLAKNQTKPRKLIFEDFADSERVQT